MGRVSSAAAVRPRPDLRRPTVLTHGPWTQPFDETVTIDQYLLRWADFRAAVAATPDLAGAPYDGGVLPGPLGFTNSMYKATASSYDYTGAGLMFVVDLRHWLANPQTYMPPVGPSEAEVAAYGASGWEAESSGGVMRDDIRITVRDGFSTLSGFEDDQIDRLAVQIRRLGAADWTLGMMFAGDMGEAWPSEAWLAARTLLTTVGANAAPLPALLGTFSRSADLTTDGSRIAFSAALNERLNLPTAVGVTRQAYFQFDFEVTYFYTPPRWRFTY